jgi:hypothetical protein
MTPSTGRRPRPTGPVLFRPGVGGVVSVADTPSPTVTGGVVTVITPPVGGVTVMTPPRRHPPTPVTTPSAVGGGGLAHHPKQHPRVGVPEAPARCKAETGQSTPADASAPGAGSGVRTGPSPRVPARFPRRQRPIRRRPHVPGPSPSRSLTPGKRGDPLVLAAVRAGLRGFPRRTHHQNPPLLTPPSRPAPGPPAPVSRKDQPMGTRAYQHFDPDELRDAHQDRLDLPNKAVTARSLRRSPVRACARACAPGLWEARQLARGTSVRKSTRCRHKPRSERTG